MHPRLLRKLYPQVVWSVKSEVMLKRRLRVTVAVSLSIILLAVTLRWSRREIAYATPVDCVSAYYEACHGGNETQYRTCFADSIRSQFVQEPSNQNSFSNRRRQEIVKNWVVVAESTGGNEDRSILVDEVRADGMRRLRFHLEYSKGSWLIRGIDTLGEQQPEVRFGTDVGKGAAQRRKPHAPAQQGEESAID
jgi:hypothetical protein